MLRWLDSFDRYGTPQLPARYPLGAPNAAILVAGGRRGTSGALVPGAGQAVPLAIAGTAALVSGAAVYLSPITTNTPIARLRLGGTIQCSLGRTPAGAIFVSRGDIAGMQLGISNTGLLIPNAYPAIAWQITADQASGASTVLINGVSALTFTGRNTAGAAAPGYDVLELCGDAAGAQRFDDWYVLDVTGPAPNTILADGRVDAVPPIGPGTRAQWAPSDYQLAAWQCVDDDGIPNDDTDYTETTITGLIDSFTPAGAPLPGATIYGAQLSIVARQLETPPGASAIAPLIRQFGADVVAPAVALTGSSDYGYVTARFTPPGGNAQSQAWYSTLELGYVRR